MPGPAEMTLILVLVLIVFGAGKLPQVFEAMGKGMKSFRDAQQDPPKGQLTDDGAPVSSEKAQEKTHSH